VNTLSGGAIRFRRTRAGLVGQADRHRRRIRHADVRAWIGRTARLSLLSEAALSGSVMHVHRSIIVLAGCLLLIGVSAYLILAAAGTSRCAGARS